MNNPYSKDQKKHSNQRTRKEIICRCNNVSRETIENAFENGCHTLNEIFDATTAGVGPCGGSCRRKIGPMLEKYLLDKKTKTTPEGSST